MEPLNEDISDLMTHLNYTKQKEIDAVNSFTQYEKVKADAIVVYGKLNKIWYNHHLKTERDFIGTDFKPEYADHAYLTCLDKNGNFAIEDERITRDDILEYGWLGNGISTDITEARGIWMMVTDNYLIFAAARDDNAELYRCARDIQKYYQDLRPDFRFRNWYVRN